jgi:hypothetical protein
MCREGQSEGVMADRTATRVGSVSGRKRNGSLPIVLAVVCLVGVVVGGLYVALLRVPAAPPRTQQIGSVRVAFATDPHVPLRGPATVRLSISAADGTAVTDADVSLTYDMQTDGMGRPMAGMGEAGRARARMEAAGWYVAPVAFSMAGQWAVRVAIDRDGRQEGRGVFLVVVR